MRRISASIPDSGAGSDSASPVSDASIPVRQLTRYAPGWVIDSEARQLSQNTIAAQRWLVEKLLWFLQDQEFSECGTPELRAFLAYISRSHLQEKGRWNNPQMKREVRGRTIFTYYGRLRTLFRWLVAEGAISSSPMERIKPPPHREDKIRAFTEEQIEKLLRAAGQSSNPRRNVAIILLLLDTGMRASELCRLRLQDLDLIGARRCTVRGKGDKQRTIPFDKATAKALWQYLNETSDDREQNSPLFLADRAKKAGEPLTRSGLLQLMERLGAKAGLEAVRCSPHTFRHSFAVMFLRAGGNTFSLQEMLGHESLAMVRKYVALAQADIDEQHRQFSPVARLKGRGR